MIMTTDVVICKKTTRSDELMKLMTEKKIRHMPILDGGLLVGFVSIGDVVKRLLEKYQQESDYLKKYIHS